MSIPAALQAHYDTGHTNVAVAIFILRKDGQVYAFTGHDQPFTMDVSPWGVSGNITFSATQGLTLKNFVRTLSLAPDNSEIETLDDGSLFTREDVLAGRWWRAKYRIFRYRWDVATPVIGTDVQVLQRGTLGGIKVGETTLSVEVLGLKQRLQQTLTRITSKTCIVRHGSQGPGKCNRDLTAETFEYTVSAVTSRTIFTASGSSGRDSDYFGNGELEWLTGDNEQVQAQIKSFEAGVFELHLPAVFAIQVGDTFRAVRGCRKRKSDCVARGNIINFQGQPDKPTIDDLTKTS